MKTHLSRTTYIVALCLVLLVALVAFISVHRPSSVAESNPGLVAATNDEAHTAPVDAVVGPVEHDPNVSRRSLASSADDPNETRAGVLPIAKVDADASRKMVLDGATRDTRRSYSLLLERMGLSKTEQDALMSVLIEDQIARTTTPYVRGKVPDAQERSKKIASIIGDSKLEQFVALERSLRAYGEIHDVGAVLDRNAVPLTQTQRDELLEILIATRVEFPTTPYTGLNGFTIEYLEQRLAEDNEYARHVLELATSVLSSKQLQHVFDYYQSVSDLRASALEAQKEARERNPPEDRLVLYPTP